MSHHLKKKEELLNYLNLLGSKDRFYKALGNCIKKREKSVENKVILFKKDDEVVIIYFNKIAEKLESSKDLSQIYIIYGNVETVESKRLGPDTIRGDEELNLESLKEIMNLEMFNIIEKKIKNHLKKLDEKHAEKMNTLKQNPEKLYDCIENNEIDCDDVHYFFKDDKKAISSLLVKQLLNSKKFDNVVSENLYNKQMKNEFKECKIKGKNEIDYEHFVIRFFNHMKKLSLISVVFPKVLKIANQLEPEKLNNITESFSDERFIKEFERYAQMKFKHFKRDIK